MNLDEVLGIHWEIWRERNEYIDEWVLEALEQLAGWHFNKREWG